MQLGDRQDALLRAGPYAFLDNSITFRSGLAAKSIVIRNSINCTWPSDAKTAVHGEAETARTGWFECSPAPSVAGDPESGCPWRRPLSSTSRLSGHRTPARVRPSR